MMVSRYEKGDCDLIKKKSLYSVDPNLSQRVDSNFGRDDRIVVTLFNDVEPIAVIGATLHNNGYLEWWGVIGEQVKGLALDFIRTVKAFSEEVTEKVKPNGHYYFIYENDNSSHRFAEFLGFKCKGFIKELKSTGLNYYLYERL